MKVSGLHQDTTYKKSVDNNIINTKATKNKSDTQSNIDAVFESTIIRPEDAYNSAHTNNISRSSMVRKQTELEAQNIILLLDQSINRQVNISKISENRNPFRPISQMTQEEAMQLVSSDGYFGVEKTSERLFDLAESLSGDDPEQMKIMKDAIIKGFESAKRQWGGDLPDISNDTFDAIMKKFDNWFNEF